MPMTNKRLETRNSKLETRIYGSYHHTSLSCRRRGTVRAGSDRRTYAPERGDRAYVDRADPERSEPEPGRLLAHVGQPVWTGVLDLYCGRRRRGSGSRLGHPDRLKAIRMPKPTAASAAASTTIKIENTCPYRLPHMREKATRFRFTAFRISSIDISTITTFRRVSTPITPSTNSAAATTR